VNHIRVVDKYVVVSPNIVLFSCRERYGHIANRKGEGSAYEAERERDNAAVSVTAALALGTMPGMHAALAAPQPVPQGAREGLAALDT
jgi:hypothetical protein